MIDHYARAEALLADYAAANEAATKLYTAMKEEGISPEVTAQVADGLMKGCALMLQEAQVHATLATCQRVDA